MEITELEAAYLINSFGSYADASEYSGIPVPTLSKRIARIEGELGLSIFDRKKLRGSVSLTAHGKVLMPHIVEFINTNNLLRARLDSMKNNTDKPLVVGKPVMLGSSGDAEMISGFMCAHPDARCISVIRSNAELIRLLSLGILDCAFIPCIGPTEAVTRHLKRDQFSVFEVRSSEKLKIAISKAALSDKKGSISVSEISGKKLIFNKWYNEFRQLSADNKSFFELLGCDERDFAIVNEDFVNKGYILRLAASGLGAIPLLFADDLTFPGVSLIPLEDWNITSSVILLIRREKGSICEQFNQFAEEYIKL